MTEVWPVVSATGHRPQHMQPDVHGWVREKLAAGARWLRDEHGTTVGISGMALGTDLWWAQAVLDAGIELHAYIPCPDQTARWPAHAARTWQRLLDQAAYVHQTADQYSYQCMQRRNEQMVDAAQAVVAVYSPTKGKGGTFNAIAYAERRGRPIIHLNPATRRVVGPVASVLPRETALW